MGKLRKPRSCRECPNGRNRSAGNKACHRRTRTDVFGIFQLLDRRARHPPMRTENAGALQGTRTLPGEAPRRHSHQRIDNRSDSTCDSPSEGSGRPDHQRVKAARIQDCPANWLAPVHGSRRRGSPRDIEIPTSNGEQACGSAQATETPADSAGHRQAPRPSRPREKHATLSFDAPCVRHGLPTWRTSCARMERPG